MSTIRTLPLTGSQIVSRGVSLILSSGYPDTGETHEFHIKVSSGNVHHLTAPIRFWELGFKQMHHLVPLPIDLVHIQDTDVCDSQEISRLGSGNFIITVDRDTVTLRVNGYGFELTLPMTVYQAEVLPVYEKITGWNYTSMGVGNIQSGVIQDGYGSYPVCTVNNYPQVSKLVWTKDVLWEGAYVRKAGNQYQDSGKFKTWMRVDDGFWAAMARPLSTGMLPSSAIDRVLSAARQLTVHEDVHQ